MELMQERKIRVLLADDHPLVMKGFSLSLSDLGVEVVGEAKNADEAIAMYSQLLPDVIVLDLRFGEKLTGLDVAKEIFKVKKSANIIFLSQFDQDSLITETYKLGAKSFITKDCDSEELMAAVTKAAKGERYFLPRIAERIANISVQGDFSPRSILEKKELEVFILMAEGLTNVEMAEKLNLSAKTISNFSHSVKEKLGTDRSADIARLAIKHGLIEP
jgi:two-component system invasion response regulator UvrY